MFISRETTLSTDPPETLHQPEAPARMLSQLDATHVELEQHTKQRQVTPRNGHAVPASIGCARQRASGIPRPNVRFAAQNGLKWDIESCPKSADFVEKLDC
jgi:hypothetical protein